MAKKQKKQSNENIEYLVENAKYYFELAKYHFNKLPLAGKAGSVVAVVVIVLLGLNMCSSGSTPAPTATQQASILTVPSLQMQDRITALQKLNDLGFTNVHTESLKQYADASSEEVIINQKPQAGSKIRSDQLIVVQYGSKRLYEKSLKNVQVPNVAKLTLANANDQLTKLGFEKISAPLPTGFSKEQSIVSAVTPAIGSTTPLSTSLQLTLVPGLQMDEVNKNLAASYIPYAKYSKIENPQKLDLKLTLSKKDNTLLTQNNLDQRARTEKLAIQDVLGFPIGKVQLVNPGVKFVGDSDNAVQQTTSSGLDLNTAENACEQAEQQKSGSVSINWNTGLLQKQITDNNIALSVTAVTQNAAGQDTENIMYCVVSGTIASPSVDTLQMR